MARRIHRKQDEETTYWLSYSDMMAGLLLTFVLIIAVTMLRARVQYDEKESQLLGKEQELIIQSDALKDERALVASQQELLDEQAKVLATQQAALDEQEARIVSQAEDLRRQNELLDELQKLMGEQQAKLDNIIGVRSDLIEALRAEFENSNVHIAVDEKTGAITFDSSILFEYNAAELKPSGEQFLNGVLPVRRQRHPEQEHARALARGRLLHGPVLQRSHPG